MPTSRCSLVRMQDTCCLRLCKNAPAMVYTSSYRSACTTIRNHASAGCGWGPNQSSRAEAREGFPAPLVCVCFASGTEWKRPLPLSAKCARHAQMQQQLPDRMCKSLLPFHEARSRRVMLANSPQNSLRASGIRTSPRTTFRKQGLQHAICSQICRSDYKDGFVGTAEDATERTQDGAAEICCHVLLEQEHSEHWLCRCHEHMQWAKGKGVTLLWGG